MRVYGLKKNLKWCGGCRDGEVFAWGINDFGQLGDGSTSYATSPVKVIGLENVPNVSDISAGGWHSLALTDEGGESQIETLQLVSLKPYRCRHRRELAPT